MALPSVDPPIVQEPRVVIPLSDASPIVQEPRVVLPVLAVASPPVHTTPLAPLPSATGTYPPPPGLPALPDTDRPNSHLGTPNCSARPYSPVFSSTPCLHPQLLWLFCHNCPATSQPTQPPILPCCSAVVDLLAAAADVAWLTNIDHISPANGAKVLNVNPDGSPLTYRTAKHGAERSDWQGAEDTEWDRLFDTTTCHGIHLAQQPIDRRRGDTTYYNPKPKEKYDDDMSKVYRIRGTAGGDKIHYDGPTKVNTAAMSTVKILLQSVVSDDADFMTLDIKDFYLMTPLHCRNITL